MKFSLLLVAQTVLLVRSFRVKRGPQVFQPYSIQCPVKSEFIATRLHALDVDIWTINTDSVHVFIRQHELLKDVLQTLGLKSKDECQVIFHDVNELFKRNGQNLEKRIQGSQFFDEFQSYENINGQLEEWATAFPILVTLTKIGSSVEGRDILCIGLSDYTQSSTKRTIFWLGGMHAREQFFFKKRYARS
jgi:hypothetical protein